MNIFKTLVAGSSLVMVMGLSPIPHAAAADKPRDDNTALRPSFIEGEVSPQTFVEKAAVNGMAEVELAKMALAKSTLPEVRHFAQMMLEDHTAVNKELRKMATDKGLTIPDEPTLTKQAKAHALKMREGESFDQAYATHQLQAHEKTLVLFRKAANSSDATINEFADTILPTLEHHFSLAQTLSNTVAKEVAVEDSVD